MSGGASMGTGMFPPLSVGMLVGFSLVTNMDMLVGTVRAEMLVRVL